MKHPPKKILLKDQLFNKENVGFLADFLKKAYPKLDATKFEKDIIRKFPKLELKERIFWIRENIEKHFPKDYEKTLCILLHSFKNKSEKENFVFASFSDYVAMRGVDKKYIDTSLYALGEFTKYFSAEFAIRNFINTFPKKTFAQMQIWSLSKNIHQRRLASEGLRPKLPWAKSISFDYKKSAKILDNLFYDTERYVTRSVTNHLNDISKIDPDFVLKTLQKWEKSKKQNTKEMVYIIRHSLRTLIKKGHANTLAFLGYDLDSKIEIQNLKLERKNIALGDMLIFSFTLLAKVNTKLIIDYKIIYANPQNRYSEKVFKIKTCKIIKEKKMLITKKHRFQKMTTKKLYSGTHTVQIQINGKIPAEIKFNLKV